MCGIAGAFNFDPKRAVAESAIRAMTDPLAHRGPDGSGVYCRGSVGLGHRRLAIVDLSPLGAQPMGNEDGSVQVTLNGEIYNHRDLRAWLESKGHVFRSQADTEVIVHLWEEKQERCVEDLQGMFAFALWDSNREVLFLARDREGEKPLFYAALPDRFLFGSEIKAILADPDFQTAPDIVALQHYLAYQSVPAPMSAFRGIHKLRPAESILVTRTGPKPPRTYWKLSYALKRRVSSPAEEAALQEELVERLRDAVRQRLMSDVPLGAFLSGGLDSSMIVALMAGLMDRPVKTFSIGFADEAYNELPYARVVADRYRTEHHEFIVTPDARAILPDLVWHYNEPFADSSAIPTFYVSKLARQHVTVALTGDGGDEAFGGYARYVGLDAPTLSPADLASLQAALPRGRSAVPAFQAQYYYKLTHFHELYQRDLFAPAFASRLQTPAFEWMAGKFAWTDAASPLEKAMQVDLRFYLPDTLMTKVDVASMAYSLETRPPFLDHRFLEFAATVPADLKVAGGVTKKILKDAAAPYLPESLIHRRKMGFGVPIDLWFRGELRDFVRSTLLSQTAKERGYFNQGYVETLISRHEAGESWQYPIWNLLMFELWHQMFIDRSFSRTISR